MLFCSNCAKNYVSTIHQGLILAQCYKRISIVYVPINPPILVLRSIVLG